MQELVGGKEKPVERPQLASDLFFPERRRLAEAFVNTGSFRDNETAHQVGVVEDMISLCSRRSLVLRPRQRRPSPCSTPDTGDEKVETQQTATQEDVEERQPSIVCEPTQCLECISNGTQPAEERFKSYGSKDSLRRHYDRRHNSCQTSYAPSGVQAGAAYYSSALPHGNGAHDCDE
jgi:hypothetical protein